MSLQEVADAVGGRLVGVAPDTVVSAPASIDSRAVNPGGLFVALPGERVDGHDYAAAAVAAGATAVLAQREVDAPAVLVDDTTLALGRLAAAVRERLTGCTVLALTGSQGKTGTKDLIAHLLEPAGAVVATTGSLNNEFGVPLTVLRADDDTTFLICEMGTRGHGQIRYLTDIARPRLGLVLNVGVAHLGEFGTQDDIAQAKGELIEALPADGAAVLNADDPLVAAMAARTSAPVTTFGTADDADVRIRGLRIDDEGRPTFELVTADASAPVALQLLGAHQASNAAGAAAVALALGRPLAEVAARLSTAEPASRWRMERHERADGVLVINDAYNANPDSMRSALETLAVVGRGRGARTVAVLGEMLELGATSADEHEALGRVVAELGIGQLVVVGDGARHLHAGAVAAGMPAEPVQVDDGAAATAYLAGALRPGDVVLVKASRATGLERVASSLLKSEGDTAAGNGAHDAASPSGGTPTR